MNQTTRTYKDLQGRTVRTVYPDGSFSETLYSVGGVAVSEDQEGNSLPTPNGSGGSPNEGWSGIPAGGQEVVNIAQRQSTDSRVITYELHDVAGQLTDVWQPQVADALNSGTLTRPHWQYAYDAAGNQTGWKRESNRGPGRAGAERVARAENGATATGR